MCRNTVCQIPPPPPPFGTCATLDAGGAPEKSVGVPPSPPPPPPHCGVAVRALDLQSEGRDANPTRCVRS